jgi:hypothetical protein
MASNVIPFRDPYLPLEGIERLRARRIYRENCRAIAEKVVAQAFTEAGRVSGAANLGIDDVLPVFVAAIRRELRKAYQC